MILLALVIIAMGAMLGLIVGLVGLFEAPWPVLLGLLLLALYGLQWLSNQGQAVSEGFTPGAEGLVAPDPNFSEQPAADSSSQPTSLTYRGISYELKPASDSSQSDASPTEELTVIEGVYRGHRWQRVVTKAPPDGLPDGPPEQEA